MRKIIVVGSGIIGLSCAAFLALEGKKVQVITRNPEEATSWVAGGMLAPFSEGLEEELFNFSYQSLREYPEFIRFLMEASGHHVDFREGGIYRIVLEGEEKLIDLGKLYKKKGHRVEFVEPKEELNLSKEVVSIIHYGEEGWVDAEMLMDSLLFALQRMNVEFVVDEITRAVMADEEVKEIIGIKSVYRGDFYLFAPGAWTKGIFDLPVYPLKGQALKARGVLLPRVHYSTISYLIPRTGYLYIGATSEDVGFLGGVSLEGLKKLSEGALRIVPRLSGASITDMVFGYRPATPDGKPIFEAGENYLVLTGHHRNGILHAPLTAKLALDYLRGSSNKFLETFSKDRFLKKT
ncbi:MAG: FAD-dependent oxidoreductase [Aquificaceae bacterium]|nr:FAD-dependent oxidoreductase [Aquificaceae bacterium]